MPLRRDQLDILRLALASLGLAAFVAVWELAARQAPFTLFAIRQLPGPIAQLREHLLFFGLLAMGTSWALPVAFPEEAPARFRRSMLASHIALGLALLYAAATGRMALQLWDPRPIAVVSSVLRVVSEAWVIGTYAVFAWRVLRGPRTDERPDPNSNPNPN